MAHQNLDVNQSLKPSVILGKENNNTIYQLNGKDLTNEKGWYENNKIKNNVSNSNRFRQY